MSDIMVLMVCLPGNAIIMGLSKNQGATIIRLYQYLLGR